METRKGLIDESDPEVTYVEMELEPLPNIQSPAISGSRIEEARGTGDVGACSMHNPVNVDVGESCLRNTKQVEDVMVDGIIDYGTGLVSNVKTGVVSTINVGWSLLRGGPTHKPKKQRLSPLFLLAEGKSRIVRDLRPSEEEKKKEGLQFFEASDREGSFGF
jgi:hypothetical protein